MLYGALEAGGTKMICALGDENGRILEQISLPTIEPSVTMPRIIEYFRDKEITGLGIACFGPIDLNPNSATYGFITTTPKLKWANFNIVRTMKEALHIPIGFDTDVNGSLLGEVCYGAAKGLENVLYLTIGTGVGGGVMANGRLLHGMLHPELGHITMLPHPSDSYRGHCPYHGICFEGMAAGPAIEERWGRKGAELADLPEVWELEAYYIAQALKNLILTLSPERIILGGGVMHQLQLFPMIRASVLTQLNGYLDTKELRDIDHYIVPASLHDDQGIMGCIKLAIDAAALSA
ncbi:ROK family protein [Oribacterium sp. oral taxon 102]|uniref:ROK family protein n=1 Tax=Oribacterium sp. oral taxon 102 TaxID=671214 RepID=UPI0015B7D3A9|nr:ROK family protein [Oribacterium sp. oral taxon 102]NWO21406.1 ROK family protein [Oribacterium sp. oral taxon 102]